MVWFIRHMLLKRYMFRLWRLVRTFVVLGVIAFLVSRAVGWDGRGSMLFAFPPARSRQSIGGGIRRIPFPGSVPHTELYAQHPPSDPATSLPAVLLPRRCA